MRKDQLWARRTQMRATGFAALYPKAQDQALQDQSVQDQTVQGRQYRTSPLQGSSALATPLHASSAGHSTQLQASPAGHSTRSKAFSRSSARADAAARRRLVMTVLLTALAVPTLVALATGLTAAWWAVVALLPLVCVYVAVLFRARRLTAEKEFNIAFLGGTDVTSAGLEDIFSSRQAMRADLRVSDLRTVASR